MLALVDGDWSFENWTIAILPLFASIIWIGLEVLSNIVPFIFKNTGAEYIPVRGKHLDEFASIDKLYIFINKLLTIAFVYHLIWVCISLKTIAWKNDEVTIMNTLGSIVAFYIFYDFFYMNFHKVLHLRSLYQYVHKHHHRQKAPSRGNLDAINVHPFEFVVGEYLHLLTIYCIPCHIYTVVYFILAGGILASLNHTRFDINIPYLYSVKVHDVHHRLPESNYGQYTMFWDTLLGSYRSYGDNINASGKDVE